MYNITLEYYLLEILLVSSNRYLLNGGVILRIYYIREISINLLSRFLRKESCRSIFLLFFFFFFQRWNVEIAWNYWIRSVSRAEWKRVAAEPVARSLVRAIVFLGWGAGLVEHRRKGRMCTGRFKMWVSAVDSSLVFVHFTVHLESSFYRVSQFVHTISISILTSISRFFFPQPGPRYTLSLIIT